MESDRRVPALLLAAVLVVAFAADGAAAREDRTAPVPSVPADPNSPASVRAEGAAQPPLVPPGPSPDVAILFTGRVLGFVEPCG